MNRTDNARLPHYRWNFAFYWLEYVFFSIGMAFASFTTVVPAFVRLLTDSAPLVGLSGTVFTVGWTAPQMVMARLVRNKPRLKPYMMWGLVGRVCPWLIALGLWAGLAQRRGLMLALFFGCIALFSASDGMAGVPWFDILRRTVPIGRRGRLFGTAQAVTGIAGIGAGMLVTVILKRNAFPGNYALLFTIFSAFLVPSALALALIREPAPEAEQAAAPSVTPSHWLKPLLADRMLLRLMACRILGTMAGLATPFFVLHAQDVLHLPQAAIGTFVIAQTLASVLGSILLGIVSERRGPHAIIRIGVAAGIAGPLFALAVHYAGSALASVYPVVFVALGVANSTYMLGFSNYVLEIAPPELCTTYVGVTNTIGGVLSLMPVMGGLLLEATSYPTLFVTAILFGLLSLVLALGLAPAHHSRPLPEPAAQAGDA